MGNSLARRGYYDPERPTDSDFTLGRERGRDELLRRLPVRGRYKVVVVGAGPAGIAPRVTPPGWPKDHAGEKYGFPRRRSAPGAAPPSSSLRRHGRQLMAGLAEEVIRRMDARGAASFLVNRPVRDARVRPLAGRPLRGKVITGPRPEGRLPRPPGRERRREAVLTRTLHGVLATAAGCRESWWTAGGSGILEATCSSTQRRRAPVHRAGGAPSRRRPTPPCTSPSSSWWAASTPHDPAVNARRYDEAVPCRRHAQHVLGQPG